MPHIGVQLLVIDEISTVGAAQFEIVSRRLDQVRKVLWRERFHTAAPDDDVGFGGIGVVCMGDFAQLPPVLSTLLLMGSPIQDAKNSGLRTLALTGRQRFKEFKDVIRLRRIHRIQGADPYKETTMRLRDAAITFEDYSLWKEHEIAALDIPSAIGWTDGEALLRDCLCLVTDNAQAGRINGGRLACTIPFRSEPALGSSRDRLASTIASKCEPALGCSSSVAVRCESRHNNPRAANRKASDFRNVRKACHLRVGARVMLSLNSIWDVPTVPLGPMNGARGIVVAICYATARSQRVDGNAMAGTGWPDTDSRGMPRGLDQCPLPDFVVVQFPSYKGPQIFAGLPSTWVPIPCCEVRSQTSKSCVRVGVPLKLAWALTFHKSQGITAPEGTLISFEGSRMPRAASKPGLAFVGWTRATTWEKVVFQKLPPIEDFLAVRMQTDFKSRTLFEAEADKLHDDLLLRHGITEAAHIADHQEHLKRVIMARDGRPATQAELDDIASMLKCRGVVPMPKSIQEHLQQKGKVTSANGIWGICMAFRADTSARREARKHLAKSDRPSLGSRFDARNYISQELANAADAQCEDAPPLDDEDECNWCAAAIASLGFDEALVTRILEENDFSFPKTLSYFVNGMDSARDVTRFRRHTRKKVVCGINVEKLASDAVRDEYIERANAEFGHFRFVVVDLGQHACSTTWACF